MNELFSTLFGLDSLLVGTIVPFLFVLTVVVFVHEMGHYLVGRWCGIGVKAFSIGFGPEIFGFNDRRGTRWKLSAIPLGGYVKFVGDMNVTSTPDAEETEKLTPAERQVAFHTQPVWKRAATVVAGPLFNFLLTIAVLATFFMTYGRVVSEPMIAEVQAGSPAEIAGFMPGDRFVSVDGSPVRTFADVQYRVSGRAGDPLVFVLLRDGKEIELTATPKVTEQKDAAGNTFRIGVIGVVNNNEVGQFRVIEYSVPGAVAEAVSETGRIIVRTGQFLKRFAIGREDKCQLGGPIKIADMAGKAAKLGFERLVELIALLSVGIGFLNLLPIPPLDGGHLVFYGIEAVIRRPLSERMMEAVYRTGMILVLAFMAFVFWNDLFGC
ncbi:RIP metalloprotease RseP [Allomesorhizobium camelthorni]|uniref:Zinc metalloprotease n=1 Tax=Allomesorhizobium camelthorni TaxID=475069 RepID=A0A6G4WH18_9HYPH|nr:RIP metalloprotease RseP [Mesorhizobium camelthorni]NGO53420.1 RIP metalloprotease RseP [Mesorhizobium camelthorni]